MRGFWLGACVCLVASTVDAAPILIDFEDVPGGSRTSFTKSGVTFSAIDGSAFRRAETPNGSDGLLSLATPRQLFRADIAGGASFVSVDLGDFGGDPDLLKLSIYDATNQLLGTTTMAVTSSFVGMRTLSLSGSNITYAIFGGEGTGGSSVFADNFVFEAVAVPEPGSVVLLGLGGLGLAGGWWRRGRGWRAGWQS